MNFFSIDDQIHRAIEDSSRLIEEILIILSINNNIYCKNQELEIILN